jgi:hypothetical protein
MAGAVGEHPFVRRCGTDEHASNASPWDVPAHSVPTGTERLSYGIDTKDGEIFRAVDTTDRFYTPGRPASNHHVGSTVDIDGSGGFICISYPFYIMGRTVGINSTFQQLEERFRIRLSGITEVENDGYPGVHKALKQRHRENVLDNLYKEYDSETVDSVFRRLEAIKSDSTVEPTCQTYEKIHKELFDLETDLNIDVRNQGTEVLDFDPAEKRVHEELYEISQGFLDFGSDSNTWRLHRGVRRKSAAKLISDTIDSPDSDTYLINDSVVSHHTDNTYVARRYTDKIAISWNVPIWRIALAHDHILDVGPKEAEHHVFGGDITVQSHSVVHYGDHTNRVQKLHKTIEAMREPHEMNLNEHREVAELVHLMYKEGRMPSTEAGKQRLRKWFQSDSAQSYIDDEKRNIIGLIVHNS